MPLGESSRWWIGGRMERKRKWRKIKKKKARGGVIESLVESSGL